MLNEINAVIERAVESFRAWEYRSDKSPEEIERAVESFRKEFFVREGKKYNKIVRAGSAWAFVVATDTDRKFKKGDILKAASWAAPARNFTRGNVFDGVKNVYWTGW